MTARPVRTELPRWLSSASVAWVGALLALMAVTLAGGFLWYEQREIHKRELQSTELLARSLEDHANRTFNTIDIALTTLAETVRGSLRSTDPARLGPALLQTQQGMPFLGEFRLGYLGVMVGNAIFHALGRKQHVAVVVRREHEDLFRRNV